MEERILSAIKANAKISQTQMVKEIGVSVDTVKYHSRLRLRWKTPGGVKAVFEQILRFESGRPLCPDMTWNYVLADRAGWLHVIPAKLQT